MRPSMQKLRQQDVLWVAILALGCVLLLIIQAHPYTVDEFGNGLRADNVYFLRLATDGPSACQEAPYCWRWLMPSLAHVVSLPGGASTELVQANYFALTAIFVWATGVVLYLLLRSYRLDRRYSALGMILYYSFGWATGFLFFFFWMSESLLFLLIVASLLCIRRGYYRALVVLMIIGALTKETMLIVAPLYYTLNIRLGTAPNSANEPVHDLSRAGSKPRLRSSRLRGLFDTGLIARTLLLVVVGVSVVIMVRLLTPTANHYDMFEQVAYYVKARAEGTLELPTVLLPGVVPTLPGAFLLGNVATYGFALLLPFVALRENIGLAMRYSPFILLVEAQLLVGSATERLLVYTFPVVVLMSVKGLKAIQSRMKIPFVWLALVPVGWFVITLGGIGWQWTFLETQGVVLIAGLIGGILSAFRMQYRLRTAGRNTIDNPDAMTPQLPKA